MSNLVFLLIVLPVISAMVCFLIRVGLVRTITVTATGAVLGAASLMLLGQGDFTCRVPGGWETLVTILDFALLALVLFFGFRLNNRLIKSLTIFQLVLLAV